MTRMTPQEFIDNHDGVVIESTGGVASVTKGQDVIIIDYDELESSVCPACGQVVKNSICPDCNVDWLA